MNRASLTFVWIVAGMVLLSGVMCAWPALAQDTSDAVKVVPSALQIVLQQGITGAIALLCLAGLVFKDRQITRERDASAATLKAERDAWSEKLFALSLAHATETTKQTMLAERVARHLDKG